MLQCYWYAVLLLCLICLNECFSVSKSMRVTDRQTDRHTYRANTRDPSGPKNDQIKNYKLVGDFNENESINSSKTQSPCLLVMTDLRIRAPALYS